MKPDKFNINESLTPQRNIILYQLHQAVNKQPNVINSCNSSHSSVVAWLHAASSSAKTKYRKIIVIKKALFFTALSFSTRIESHSLTHGQVFKLHSTYFLNFSWFIFSWVFLFLFVTELINSKDLCCQSQFEHIFNVSLCAL